MFFEPSYICEVKQVLNKIKVSEFTPTKLTWKTAGNSRPKQEVGYVCNLIIVCNRFGFLDQF